MVSTTFNLSYKEVLLVIYPIFDFTACLCFLTSSPSTIAVPFDGSNIPAIMRNVVVLPHPLGPRILKTFPCSKLKSRESTARKFFFLGPNSPFFSVGTLNCFDKFFTSIIVENF